MQGKFQHAPVVVGLTMALMAVAAALAVALVYPLSAFPELVTNCRLVDLAEAACSAGARKAGLYSVGAATTVLVAALLAMWCRQSWHAIDVAPLHPFATSLILSVAMTVAAVHMVVQYLGPAEISRISVIKRYATLISLENLLWPLLLQILVMQRSLGERLRVLAAILPIAILTPYRGAMVAIVIFGFLLPCAIELWELVRSAWPRPRLREWLAHAAIVAIGSACIGSMLYFESKNRNLGQLQVDARERWMSSGLTRPDDAATHTRASRSARVELAALAITALPSTEIAENSRQDSMSRLWGELAQRTVHPLYQAAMLEKVGQTQGLPTILDEWMRKLRLSSATTLNEVIYKIDYGGQGVGQATVLYYGEAVAYFPALPLAWMIGMPLAVVGVWLALRRLGFAVSTIFGIALWRGSLAGMVTVLPALTMQVLAIVAATGFGGWAASTGARRAWIARLTHGIFLAAVAALLVATLTVRTDAFSRNFSWVVGFAPPAKNCEFAPWRLAPYIINEELARHGIEVEALSVDEDRDLPRNISAPVLVEIPYGLRAKALTSALTEALRPIVYCDSVPRFLPVVFTEQWVDRDGRRTLEFLLIAVLLISAATTARKLWCSCGQGEKALRKPTNGS